MGGNGPGSLSHSRVQGQNLIPYPPPPPLHNGKNPHRQVDQVRVGQNKIIIPIPYTRGMSIYHKYIAI